MQSVGITLDKLKVVARDSNYIPASWQKEDFRIEENLTPDEFNNLRNTLDAIIEANKSLENLMLIKYSLLSMV